MTSHQNSLSISELKRLLDYDSETGVFLWRVEKSRRRPAGSIAGGETGPKRRRYLCICINYRRYMAHRLAWFWMTGTMPPDEMCVDHINGDALDNRWSNLRLASSAQNQWNKTVPLNNPLGVTGVQRTADGRYRARIAHQRKERQLGVFDTPEEAGAAYQRAAAELRGDFMRQE